jgi:uncharacterized membrane protein YhfC
MIEIAYPLAAMTMLFLPVGLGMFLAERLGTSWRLFGIGALTFIGSQAVHIPLLFALTGAFKRQLLPTPPPGWALASNAVLLGLAAGLCEELARFLVYRRWLVSARSWRDALMFGAGHGGAEAIIFGILAGLTFVKMLSLRSADLGHLPVTAAQLLALRAQVAAYWSAPWYDSLLGAIERASALCLQISFTVMVLQAVRRRSLMWLAAAILWHAVVDGTVVVALSTGGIYRSEAALVAFAACAFAMTLALRSQEQAAAPVAAVALRGQAGTAAATPPDSARAEAAQRRIEDSRFSR